MALSRTIIFCMLSLCGVGAHADAGALTFLSKISQMRSEGKLPGLDADGITLPKALLLDKLRAAVNSKDTEVKDLELLADKGVVKVLSRGKVDSLLTVNFVFREVDWKKRTLWVEFSESADSASNTLLGQIFGTIAIFAFEAASGSGHVKSALIDKPYCEFNGNRVAIMLDKVPSLKGPLELGVGKYRLFDYLGVKSVATEPGQIRVALGLIKN